MVEVPGHGATTLETRMFEGKVVFVCVDADGDSHMMISDESAVEQWWEDNPNGDGFACAQATGRYATDAEASQLSFIEGCIAY